MLTSSSSATTTTNLLPSSTINNIKDNNNNNTTTFEESLENKKIMDENKKLKISSYLENNNILKLLKIEENENTTIIILKEQMIEFYLFDLFTLNLTKINNLKIDNIVKDGLLFNNELFILTNKEILCYDLQFNLFKIIKLNVKKNNLPINIKFFNNYFFIFYLENEIHKISKDYNDENTLQNKDYIIYLYKGVYFQSILFNNNYLYLNINQQIYYLNLNNLLQNNLFKLNKLTNLENIYFLFNYLDHYIFTINENNELFIFNENKKIKEIKLNNLILDIQINSLNGNVYLLDELNNFYLLDLQNELKINLILKLKFNFENFYFLNENYFLFLNNKNQNVTILNLEENKYNNLLNNISSIKDILNINNNYISINDKKLQFFTKSIYCNHYPLIDISYNGINGLFNILNKYIILSFTNQTKILFIDNNNTIEEIKNFNEDLNNNSTIYSNLLNNNYILQILNNFIKIYNLDLNEILNLNFKNSIATHFNDSIYTCYKNKLSIFRFNLNKLNLEFNLTLNSDISSIFVNLNYYIFTNYESYLFIYKNLNNELFLKINLNELFINENSTNIVESIYLENNTLYIGTRDGYLYILNLNNLNYIKYKLGELPIKLFYNLENNNLLIITNYSYLLNLNNNNILFLNLNENILYITKLFENEFIYITNEGNINCLKMEENHLTFHLFKEFTNIEEDINNRITINEHLGYLCKDYSIELFNPMLSINSSDSKNLFYLNPLTHEIKELDDINTSELKCLFKLNNNNFKFKNIYIWNNNYLIITVEHLDINYPSLENNNNNITSTIYIFNILNNYKLITYFENIPNKIYNITSFKNNYLLITYGNRMGLFKLENKEENKYKLKLIDQISTRYFIHSISINSNNKIVITDRYDGLIFYELIENEKLNYLEYYYHPIFSNNINGNNINDIKYSIPTSAICKWINNQYIITCDRKYFNIQLWKVKDKFIYLEDNLILNELPIKILDNDQIVTINGSIYQLHFN
ncbi:hypothetical protein ABK040_005587 [Willaertia magna]